MNQSSDKSATTKKLDMIQCINRELKKIILCFAQLHRLASQYSHLSRTNGTLLIKTKPTKTKPLYFETDFVTDRALQIPYKIPNLKRFSSHSFVFFFFHIGFICLSIIILCPNDYTRANLKSSPLVLQYSFMCF